MTANRSLDGRFAVVFVWFRWHDQPATGLVPTMVKKRAKLVV
jgi:hypothetical protein